MTRTDLERELERLHPESFRWAFGCCRRDRELAMDVLQASYVKVLEGKARFEGRSTFRTFLFGVIRRTAAEERRKGWLARLRLARYLRAETPPLESGGREEGLERAAGLRAALGRLATRQRQVLELVFDHDLTVEEAAAALGLSVGSARVHYERGKKRLRKALGG